MSLLDCENPEVRKRKQTESGLGNGDVKDDDDVNNDDYDANYDDDDTNDGDSRRES